MTEFQLWIVFAGMTIITFATRDFFLFFGSRFHIPDAVNEVLRYAPTAALIAIVLPEIIFIKDPASQLFELNLFTPKTFSGLVAVVCFLFTKSMLKTIFWGMAAFTIFRFLI